MLSREELTQLAERILAEGDPLVLERLIDEFDQQVPHPAPSDLFLFPELQFGDRMPSVTEIVDAAVDYVDTARGVTCLPRVTPRARSRQRRGCPARQH